MPREKFHMGSAGRTWSPKKSPIFFDLNIISPFSVDQTWTFVLFLPALAFGKQSALHKEGGKVGEADLERKNRVCRQVEAEREEEKIGLSTSCILNGP